MLTLRAPAKINLCLHILGKRTDGYHDIFSLMQAVSIYDNIVLAPRKSGITLTVEGADIPAGPENLVYRAAEMMLNYSSKSAGVHIKLHKNIPVGAGLGGGSSDAAATLKGINMLFDLGLSREKLMELGACLGADVPFFLLDTPAQAEGIGERLTPLPKWKYYIVLVYPGINIPTAWAYENLKFQLTKKADYNKMQLLCYQKKDMGLLCRRLKNDFEDSIIRQYPVIQKIKDDLVQCGALGSLMTGTGSCVFGVFNRKSDSTLCYRKYAGLAGADFWIAEAETI